MQHEHQGRVRRFGDNVNTDYIITSARKRESLDGAVLKPFLFETLDPHFAGSVRDGDMLVAGRNFGCGSAMEVAVTVILAAGIRVVLAQSFSRSFYRNAINNGLLPVECDTDSLREGDMLRVQLTNGTPLVMNDTARQQLQGAPLTPIMMAILASGGLVPYVRSRSGA